MINISTDFIKFRKTLELMKRLKETTKNIRPLLFKSFRMRDLQELAFVQLCEKDKNVFRAMQRNISLDFKNDLVGFVERCTDDKNRQKNDNFNVVISGEQGTGKSVLATAIALKIKELHKKIWGRDVNIIYTFNDTETLEAFSKVNNFDIIIQDETDKLMGEGARTTLSNLGNLIKRARAWGICYIKLGPEIENIAGNSKVLMPTGYYKKGREEYWETGSVKNAYSRGLIWIKDITKKKYVPLGYIVLYVGDAIKYMEKINYAKLKEDSWNKIKQGMGGASGSMEERRQKIIDAANIVYEWAIEEMKWKGSAKALENLMVVMPLNLVKVPLTTKEKKAIVQLCANRYKNFGSEDDIENIFTTETNLKKDEIPIENEEEELFDADKYIDEILENISKYTKSKINPNAIEMYRMHLENYTQRAIAQKFNISPQRVSQHLLKVRGIVSNKLGHLYEAFLRNKLAKNPKYKRVVNNGDYRKPDIIAYAPDEVVIYSVKALSFNPKSSFSIQYTEFKPEILQAIEFKKKGKYQNVRVIFHIYCLNNNKVYEYDCEDVLLNPEYDRTTINKFLKQFTLIINDKKYRMMKKNERKRT